MKAIVMAGGFAKRLWPLTKDKPKPLLTVGGKPIVEHILENLEDFGDISTEYLFKSFSHLPNHTYSPGAKNSLNIYQTGQEPMWRFKKDQASSFFLKAD